MVVVAYTQLKSILDF